MIVAFVGGEGDPPDAFLVVQNILLCWHGRRPIGEADLYIIYIIRTRARTRMRAHARAVLVYPLISHTEVTSKLNKGEVLDLGKVHIFSKMILAGDKIEIYQYSKPIAAGQSRMFDVIRSSDDGEGDKREDNLYRARQTLRRLIWSNRCNNMKFLTLTYAETVLDVKRVQRDITTFLQSMRRRGYSMDYVYVLENQKERGEKDGNAGCLHVHFILFNENKIDLEDLNAAWPHGRNQIRKVRGIRDYGAYVSKYITKDTFAAFGQHSYRTSLGLKKPEEVNFYTEEFADGFNTEQFHPNDILRRLVPTYYNKQRRDFRDKDGVGHVQEITYYQGVLTEDLRSWIEEHREHPFIEE